ncbi:MAG: 3'-5' exonuclease [Erysipelotrichia bacterium]|nr:3'-5' exonuclease [Erysipelotrichia bacterium]
MAYYVLFDTETTGNQEEDKIIQFGAMIVDQKGKVEAFDELCSTDIDIKLEAMEVHNITPNLLLGKPKATQTDFYKRLEELNSNENYLIAHNISFDLGMIKKEGFINQYQIIDTLRCAKHLFPELPYHRLQYIRYALELYKVEEIEAAKHNITIKAHDAIGDVLVMKLFLTKTPVFIKTFRFGKYKGKDIEEVATLDSNYLNWMRTSMSDLDEDMKYTLDKVLKS